MSEAITVLVVDDHEVVRQGVRALLETEPDIRVVGEAATGHEAVTAARELRPDVVLMDLVMPELDGISAIRRILEARPEAQVLVLTSFGGDDKLFPAIEAGAIGYLLKDTRPGELLHAVREAARGRSFLTPVVARRLLRQLTPPRTPTPPPEELTPREVDVLRQVARGLSNEGIASELSISEATVRTHVSHILAKLGLQNRTQAALYALRTGLISLSEVGE